MVLFVEQLFFLRLSTFFVLYGGRSRSQLHPSSKESEIEARPGAWERDNI